MSQLNMKAKDMLFEEGDQSKSLYLIKKGMLRVFKRKGDTSIEIETLRAGQLIGGLAFLDNQPRSASAEAITESELVEISQGVFDEALSKTPEWLIMLIKTITARVRSSTNKVRMLEKASTEYEVDKYGNRSKEYVFVSVSELLRFSTALLTVASRYGKNESAAGVEIKADLVEKFAAQILQVSASKVISLIELFKQIEILKGDLVLTDIRFMDQMIQYLNDQNLVEPSKKRVLTSRGFAMLSLIVQCHVKATLVKDDDFKVNVGTALKEQNIPGSYLQELFEQGFITDSQVVNSDEINVTYVGKKLMFDYRVYSMLATLEKLNEQKRQK